jgi:hypothetical protein
MTICAGKVTIAGPPPLTIPSGLSSRLPTLAELTTLLAMNAPSTCGAFDGAANLRAVMNAGLYWTSTPSGTGFLAVNFADGSVSTSGLYFICVN